MKQYYEDYLFQVLRLHREVPVDCTCSSLARTRLLFTPRSITDKQNEVSMISICCAEQNDSLRLGGCGWSLTL